VYVNALARIAEYPPLEPKEIIHAGFFTQLALILKREMLIFVRDPRPSRIQFVQTLFFAVLVGILFLQLPHNQQGLRDRFGMVFWVSVNCSMVGIITTILTFPEQRLLVERERNNSMYQTTAYLMAATLVQMPQQMLFTLIYLLIVYWMVGMDSSFLEVYLTLALCMLASGSTGLLVGCFAKDVTEGMSLMPMAIIPFFSLLQFRGVVGSNSRVDPLDSVD